MESPGEAQAREIQEKGDPERERTCEVRAATGPRSGPRCEAPPARDR